MGHRIIHLTSQAQSRGGAVAFFAGPYLVVSTSAHALWGQSAILACVRALGQKARASGGLAPLQYFVFEDEASGPRLRVREADEGIIIVTLDSFLVRRGEA